MIRVVSFDILTSVKSCHFYFLSRDYLDLMSFNIVFAFYWIVIVLSPKLQVWYVNLVDSVLFSFLFDFSSQFHHLILCLIGN